MKRHVPKSHVGSELVSECPHFLVWRMTIKGQPHLAGAGLALDQAAAMVGFAGPLLVEMEARRGSARTVL